MHKLLFLIILMIGYTPVFGQSSSDYIVNINHINTKDGLSNRDIQAIYQDSRGLIWLGTKYGLNQYDGYNFKWFTKEKNGLASNTTQLILEDKEGWLWLFEMGNWENVFGVINLSFINIHTLEVQSVEERLPNLPFPVTDIFSAIVDTNGIIWLGMRDGKLVSFTGQDLFIQQPKSRNGSPLKLYSTYDNQSFLVALFSINGQQRPLVILDTLNQVIRPVGGQQDDFVPLGENKDSMIWLAITEHLENRKSLTYFSQHKQGAPIKKDEHLAFNIEGKIENDWLSVSYWQAELEWIWYKSTTDLIVFHPEQGLLYDFKENFSEIIKNEIHRIFFDDSGTIYVGTAQGLYLLKIGKSKFNRFLYKDALHGFNETYSCRQMTRVGTDLLVNTNKRRQKINLETGEITTLPIHRMEYGASTDFVLTAYKDQQNNIWFGENGLSKYNPKNQQEAYFSMPEGKEDKIWCIFQPDKEYLWLGLENRGLITFNTTTHQFQFFYQYNEYETLAQSTIYHFEPIDTDNYLIATTSGLYILNRSKGITQRYWTGGKGDYYLPSDNVFHVHQDAENTFWATTGGNGLLELALEGGVLTFKNQFTVADGLSNNTLYGVYEDEKGWLWMPSDYGIIRFDKKSHLSKAYLPDDGISATEYNRLSHYQDEDGTLYFGSLNGVTSFHPSTFWDSYIDYQEKITITDLSYLNEKTRTWEKEFPLVEDKINIELGPKRKSFTLNFSTKDYFNTNKIRFIYRISGLNEEWIYLDKNQLTIWQLPDGNHQLEVKLQGANGQFSKEILTIPIRVTPPFYLRWYFFIGVVLATILGAILFSRFKNRRLARQNVLLNQKVKTRTIALEKEKVKTEVQNQRLKELNQTKDQLFSIIGHDLKRPALAFRSISKKINYLLERERFDDLVRFCEGLEQSAFSLNNLLDNLLKWALSQQNALKSNPVEFDAAHPITNILKLYRPLIENKIISLNVKLAEEAIVLLDLPSFMTVCRNLLDNAYKFTPTGGHISIQTSVEANNFFFIIADTGIGMTSDKKEEVLEVAYVNSTKGTANETGSGLGLSLVKELVALNNGTIALESEAGTGTQFTITFLDCVQKAAPILPKLVQS